MAVRPTQWDPRPLPATVTGLPTHHRTPTHAHAGAWREFQSAAASCQDLDALIARHEAFLSALLGRALLDDSSAQVGPHPALPAMGRAALGAPLRPGAHGKGAAKARKRCRPAGTQSD